MSETIYGKSDIDVPQLLYGMHERLPFIPDGWHYIVKPDEFIFMVSPAGKQYYVERNEQDMAVGSEKKIAGLWDFIRTRGKLKPFMEYVDDPANKICPMRDYIMRPR